MTKNMFGAHYFINLHIYMYVCMYMYMYIQNYQEVNDHILKSILFPYKTKR